MRKIVLVGLLSIAIFFTVSNTVTSKADTIPPDPVGFTATTL